MNKEKLLELADVLLGIADGREWEYKGTEWFVPSCDPMHYVKLGLQLRLKSQPEPVDPYADLKQAGKDGKVIEFNFGTEEEPLWSRCSPSWLYSADKYRIKPEPQKIPLSQNDVKSGDEFLRRDGRRFQWSAVSEKVVGLGDWGFGFDQLMDADWKIRSINETEWRPCYKLQEQ